MIEPHPLLPILVKPEHYLVELLPNYFNVHKEGTLDKTIRENQNFHVGVIRKCEERELENKVIYFEKDLAPIVNIKGLGEYHVVHKQHNMIIIRMDETIEPLKLK